MKLNDILSVSGHPGLFKYVAQGGGGIIVESITEGKRISVPTSAKVSSLSEIAIYTDGDDLPLGSILEAISAKTDGKETISHKSTPDQMKALFAEVVPGYDRERVHVSDIKKIISWYNLLTAVGMTDFSTEEQEQEQEDNTAKE